MRKQQTPNMFSERLAEPSVVQVQTAAETGLAVAEKAPPATTLALPTKTTAPTTVAKKTSGNFKKELELVLRDLTALDRQEQGDAWATALRARAGFVTLRQEAGNETRSEDIYDKMGVGLSFGRGGVKLRSLAVGRLEDLGFDPVEVSKASGFTQICTAVMKSGLEPEDKKRLVEKIMKRDRKQPEKRYTVAEVWDEIQARKVPTSGEASDPFGTDFWSYQSFDKRFGKAKFPGRFAGQAVEQLVRRFVKPDIHVFSAMLGSGTVLDVMKVLKTEDAFKGCECRGIDLVVDDELRKSHADGVRPFDATEPDWIPAFKDDWRSDLTVITPPTFRSLGQSTTQNNRDLANFSDPTQYLDAYGGIAKGALSITKPGGVIAIVTSASPAFEKASRTPDHEHQVMRVWHDSGAVAQLLGRIVVHVAKGAPEATKDPDYLTPEVLHLNVFRTPK